MNAGVKAAGTNAASAVTNLQTKVSNAASKTMSNLQNMASKNVTSSESPIFWIAIGIMGLIVFWAFYTINQANTSVSNGKNVNATKAEQTAIFETKFPAEFKDKLSLRQAMQEQQVSDKENCLINFQPLTVIHPGFVGPVKDGVYDEKTSTSTLLRMGVRCFVLPIDYHDKDTMASPFPEANKPCLLYRDDSGTVRSINGGSIAAVAQGIADVAWSDVVTQRNDPFLLFLYFQRTPQEGTKEYLNFLSQVAVDLAPLSPYLLGQTPEGVYNRQARQDQLLFVNTSQLEKKLLVFCNIDTSGFRTSAKDFKRSYLPKEDLDYWVHMRVFKQNEQTMMGLTSLPGKGVVPRGIAEKTSYYTTLPTDNTSKKNAIDGTKEKFIFTLSPQGKNPELTTTTTLLDTYGVQAVPLFLIDYTADTKALLSKWKYAWKAKPKEIRYVRPDPIVVQQQSQTVNANGGVLTIPRS
jgi:hypothetical protein